MEKKENLVGRKVRILPSYKNKAQYIGQIGVITEVGESGMIWGVRMPDGVELVPYSPNSYGKECELLPENEYHIDKLVERTAIHCTTKYQADEVTRLLQLAGYKWCGSGQNHSAWSVYGDKVCIIPNKYKNLSNTPVEDCKRLGFTIITAEQFISQNQPMNKNTQALEQIELLKAQILKIEESLKEPVWEPKVGEYVTCKPGYKSSGGKSDPQYAGAGYKEGHTYKITKVEEAPKHDSKWVLQGGNDDCGVWSAYVRPATPEEIAANQQVTVTIGSSSIPVKISKGLIEADGKRIAITDLEITIQQTKQIEVGKITSWSVEVQNDTRFLKIGCSLFSPNEIQQVITEYKRING